MKIGTVCPTVSSSLVSVAIRCRALFTWAIIGALPVGFVISMSLTAVSHDDVSNVKHADKMHPIFRWSKAQDHNIREYGKSSAVHLDKIQIPESFTCKKTNCSNRWHICDIDNLFDDICHTRLETISTCKKIIVSRLHCTRLVHYVKEAHTEARNCYIL